MYTTRILQRPQWHDIFDSMSRIYDGVSATLEILTADLGAQFEVEKLPLRGITYDASGIELFFATRDGQQFVHRISNPVRVQIEEYPNGLVAAIEFDSANDPQRILHLTFPPGTRLLEE